MSQQDDALLAYKKFMHEVEKKTVDTVSGTIKDKILNELKTIIKQDWNTSKVESEKQVIQSAQKLLDEKLTTIQNQ